MAAGVYRRLRRRVDRANERFAVRRAPARRPPIAIARQRLYILPTRGGAVFALLLLVMLLGATNYGNSMAFALTFWLAAVTLVSMHHAHRNLLGLRIERVHAAPVFAGGHAYFTITLVNPAARARRAVHVRAGDAPGQTVDVAPSAPVTVTLAAPAARRGRLACPRLRIESVYPMGLFTAWSWATPHAETLVYPRCAGATRLPRPAGGPRGQRGAPAGGDDEFFAHRPYVRGDSPRHVDWKASARSDDLLVREYTGAAAHTLWLDYRRIAGDHEHRLSQLARWVVAADPAGHRYGLKLTDQRLAPDRGGHHRRACLRALALA